MATGVQMNAEIGTVEIEGLVCHVGTDDILQNGEPISRANGRIAGMITAVFGEPDQASARRKLAEILKVGSLDSVLLSPAKEFLDILERAKDGANDDNVSPNEIKLLLLRAEHLALNAGIPIEKWQPQMNRILQTALEREIKLIRKAAISLRDQGKGDIESCKDNRYSFPVLPGGCWELAKTTLSKAGDHAEYALQLLEEYNELGVGDPNNFNFKTHALVESIAYYLRIAERKGN